MDIVAVTVLLTVFITLTVPSLKFVIKALVASGLTTTPTGTLPTGMVAVTVLLKALITLTVLLPSFVM